MDPFSKGEPIPSGRWSSATQRTLVIAGGDSPEWMPRAAAKVGMELAGLEPATSWVRYRVREPNRGDLSSLGRSKFSSVRAAALSLVPHVVPRRALAGRARGGRAAPCSRFGDAVGRGTSGPRSPGSRSALVSLRRSSSPSISALWEPPAGAAACATERAHRLAPVGVLMAEGAPSPVGARRTTEEANPMLKSTRARLRPGSHPRMYWA